MSTKLNLGCGQDIRLGYINIDANPALMQNKDITMADVRFLDPIVADDSVDEIVAFNILSELSDKEVINSLNSWYKKMKRGASIFIQNTDYTVVCNDVTFERCPNTAFNELIFGKEGQNKSAWSLHILVKIMKQIGYTISLYGIKNNSFYIEAVK